MNGDGLRTCAPVKSIKTSQQVFIGFKNLPIGYYRKLKTSGQSMCSNGRLAIETSIKNLIVIKGINAKSEILKHKRKVEGRGRGRKRKPWERKRKGKGEML